ncbi:MAG: hypothetical protein QGG90_09790 [Nitrospinota bacterium]|jgi:hypothetical protein|nr:hypothetical protein [Nitrospinota bacterium]MDP6619705.1 hypothetical protein [Nitrospinota bacterium]HJM43751.1 hypothetical protein [Nitrospinota bacterium]
MEQFLEIFLKPDNIPISGMLLIVIFTVWLSLKQAFANDRLIKEGKKDKIYDDMMK